MMKFLQLPEFLQQIPLVMFLQLHLEQGVLPLEVILRLTVALDPAEALALLVNINFLWKIGCYMYIGCYSFVFCLLRLTPKSKRIWIPQWIVTVWFQVTVWVTVWGISISVSHSCSLRVRQQPWLFSLWVPFTKSSWEQELRRISWFSPHPKVTKWLTLPDPK
jgi:hypothetical protein